MIVAFFPLTTVLATNKVFNVRPMPPNTVQKEMNSDYLLFACLHASGLIWNNPGSKKPS